MKQILLILFYIFAITIFVFIIKNIDYFKSHFKIKHSKRMHTILITIITSVLVVCVAINVIVLKNRINDYIFWKEYLVQFEEYENELKKENSTYKEIIGLNEKNIDTEPYIFENFEYVDGTVEEGYIIKDQNGNEYVWIPCDVNTLKKRNFSPKAHTSCFNCKDDNYEEFLFSAIKHSGFYISRYEIGKENGVPVSKKECEVWIDITQKEAKKIIQNMYDNKEIKCELINGYAYDTTLNWLMESNEFNIYHEDIETNKAYYTGRHSIRNIFDFTDNIFELTQERMYDVVVTRGYLGNEEIKLFSRYTILENDTNFDVFLSRLGFRTILYK